MPGFKNSFYVIVDTHTQEYLCGVSSAISTTKSIQNAFMTDKIDVATSMCEIANIINEERNKAKNFAVYIYTTQLEKANTD